MKTIDTLTIKLGSIAAHADELLSPHGHPMDREAIRGLLQDGEVRAFIKAGRREGLLPVPRQMTDDDE